MPAEDNLASRFDYLFEALDVEQSADGSIDAESPAGDLSPDAAPLRMAFAAFVLATLGAVAAVAVLLLQRPGEHTAPVAGPADPTPTPVTMANVPSRTAPASPETIVVPTEAPHTNESGPRQRPAPSSGHRPPRGVNTKGA